MNDQPLPTAHGYPLRAVNPGLYGMMSAKWIRQISILDSSYNGYWQTRGWSNVGTVNPVTFITTPQSGSQVSLKDSGGSVIIAGYAYAGDKGVSKVEVSLDDGKTWQSAQVKQPLSSTTWVLWAYEWKPTQTGEMFVYARVTDGSGQVQTSTIADTFPNGATGYASVVFQLTS
jgi:molybdenum-dependent oxidoreductase-like protein/molybdopterin-dependent oxidoreductase-like protein protein